MIALIGVIGVTMDSSTQVIAQQSTDQPCGSITFDCYQTSNFRLTHDPVICIEEPAPDTVLQSNGAFKLTYMTQQAIDDWITQLSYADFGDGGRAPQYMSSIEVPLDHQATFDFWGNCDIQIKFEPQPTPEEAANLQNSSGIASTTDPVGVTWMLPSQHQALITIYYRQVEFQCDENSCPEDYGNYMATPQQLAYAIRHELGHAFGLGHYMVSDGEMNSWTSGSSTAPSIMIPYSTSTLNFRAFGVRAQDVNELESIYGSNGFGGPSSEPLNPSPLSAPTPEMSSSDVSYWKPLIENYFGNSTNNLASNDYGTHVLELVDIFDSEHLTSIPDPVGNQTGVQFRMYMQPWLANDISFWASGEISDNDLASVMQYLYNNGMFYFQT